MGIKGDLLMINAKIEELCLEALIDGDKGKAQINEFVVDKLFATYTTEDALRYFCTGLSNLGFRLEALKKKGLVANTAKCKDANEGLKKKGIWYLT